MTLAVDSIGRDTIVAPGAAARIAVSATGPAETLPDPLPAPNLDTRATAALTAAPAEIAAILGVPVGRRAVRREETTLDDGQVVSVTTVWFPPDVAAGAPKLADSLPLPAGSLAYLAETTGNRPRRAHEQNSAMASNAETSSLLGVPQGSPVLFTRSRYESAAGQPIAYAETVTVAGNWCARSYTIAGP